MRIAVDTKVLVRYFTLDDSAQAEYAVQAIEGAESVVISIIVLCEIVWVLKRQYRYSDGQIAATIEGLLKTKTVETDHQAARAGLSMLRKGGDFADGVIRYQSKRSNCDAFVTFDRNFATLAGSGITLLRAD